MSGAWGSHGRGWKRSSQSLASTRHSHWLGTWSEPPPVCPPLQKGRDQQGEAGRTARGNKRPPFAAPQGMMTQMKMTMMVTLTEQREHLPACCAFACSFSSSCFARQRPTREERAPLAALPLAALRTTKPRGCTNTNTHTRAAHTDPSNKKRAKRTGEGEGQDMSTGSLRVGDDDIHHLLAVHQRM